MPAADKDLETLRKEHKDLSDYATRVVFVAITTLLLLTISVSRAWKRVQSKDVSDKIAEIGAAHSKVQQCRADNDPIDECEIEVSFVFGLQLERTYDIDTYSTNPTGPNSYPASTPIPCRDLPPEQRQKLKTDFCAEQRKLEAPLEDVAKNAFVVKAPIPGIDVTLDLRSWILGLPVVFCIFGIYLYILRKKLSLLEIAAIARLRDSKDNEVTQLDRLYFEGDRAFLDFPARLSAFLVRLAFIVLPVYLIYNVCSVAWRFSEYGGTELILTLVSLVVICLFYAVAYAQFAGYKLERQMAAIIGEEIGAKSLFRHMKKIVDVLATVVDARVTIAFGSSLLLITLLMPFTKEGFWARRNYMGYKEYSGYQLLLPSGAHWPTVPGKLGEFFSTYDRFGRGTYLLILLAVLSSAFLFIPRLSVLKRKWIVRLATAGAIVSFTFVVVDFSITLIDRLVDIGWTFPQLFAVKLIAVVATIFVAIWSRYLISRGGRRQERGRDIRVLILTLHAPLFLMAVLLARWIDLEGPVAYLAGMLLLFVGLAHLRKSVAAQAG